MIISSKRLFVKAVHFMDMKIRRDASVIGKRKNTIKSTTKLPKESLKIQRVDSRFYQYNYIRNNEFRYSKSST